MFYPRGRDPELYEVRDVNSTAALHCLFKLCQVGGYECSLQSFKKLVFGINIEGRYLNPYSYHFERLRFYAECRLCDAMIVMLFGYTGWLDTVCGFDASLPGPAYDNTIWRSRIHELCAFLFDIFDEFYPWSRTAVFAFSQERSCSYRTFLVQRQGVRYFSAQYPVRLVSWPIAILGFDFNEKYLVHEFSPIRAEKGHFGSIFSE